MISATIRDIAIIIIAVQSIVIGVMLGILIWQVWRLVKMIQNEIKPLIDDAQTTVKTVRGTATFLSDNMVEPVIHSTRTFVRWQHTFRALAGELKPRRTSSSRSASAAGTPENS